MAYPTDPDARDAIVLLLAQRWPTLPMAVRRARLWGADWFALSTPFVQKDGAGEPVAHAGVVELPLRVAGKDVTVGALHGVMAHPSRGDDGALRAAIDEALAHVDAHWPAAVLWTSEPASFAPFGFAAVPEHVFRAPLALPFESRAATTIAYTARDDIARLAQLYAERRPVSERFASRDRGPLAIVGVSLWPAPAPRIDYVDALDCAIVYDVAGSTLRVYDVIGREIPPIGEIAARLGVGVDEVELHVSPDLLDFARATVAPHPSKDVLMVRGALFAGAPPFALSPLTRP